MMIRKMLLLLGAMAAFAAFAGPAAQASGQFWYTDPGHVKVGGEDEAHTALGSGMLSFSRLIFITGSCQGHHHAEMWNSATMGEGRLTSVSITASHENPCKTNFFDCTLATSTANNLPWSITLKTNGKVDVGGVSLTNRYTGCGFIGIPDNAPVTYPVGTVTGQYEGEEIVFEESGDLELGGSPVTIDGSLEVPSITAE